MTIANLKIGTRLYGAFAILITLVIFLLLSIYSNFAKLTEAVGWNSHTYEVMIEVDSMLISLINIETGERGFALTGMDTSLEPLESGVKKFKEHHSKAKFLTSDNPAQQERLDKLAAQQEQWMATGINPVIALRRSVLAGKESMESVVALMQLGKGKQSMTAMRGLMQEIRSAEATLLVTRSQVLSVQEKWTQITIVAGGIFVLLVGMALAFLIRLKLLKVLGGEPAYATEIVNAISSGNLTVDVQVSDRSKGSLLFAMKEMRDSLTTIVGQVRQGTDTIATASSQIAAGNQDLSSRTEQQATSLEETAASKE